MVASGESRNYGWENLSEGGVLYQGEDMNLNGYVNFLLRPSLGSITVPTPQLLPDIFLSNYDDLLNISLVLQAEPSFALHQDPLDGASGLKVGITRVTSSVPLEKFQAQLSYDGSCINILALRELDFPILAEDINDPGGSAIFNGVDPGGQIVPVDLGLGLTRMVGSNQIPCDVGMKITSLTGDGNGVSVVPAGLSRTLLRGDARADGAVGIADALFIAQYLVGLREACTMVVGITCLHSVNAASVRQDGVLTR